MVNPMQSALHYSQELLNHLVSEFPQGTFVDATLGNGHDIARILEHKDFQGFVYGFDIQRLAIESSKRRLKDADPERYQLIRDSHAHLDQHIEADQALAGAIFNLGYLPGGNHAITTEYTSTLQALDQIQRRLLVGGRIIIVVYSGHPQGQVEKHALLESLAQWPQAKFQVLTYRFINQANHPPFTIVIERIQD